MKPKLLKMKPKLPQLNLPFNPILSKPRQALTNWDQVKPKEHEALTKALGQNAKPIPKQRLALSTILHGKVSTCIDPYQDC